MPTTSCTVLDGGHGAKSAPLPIYEFNLPFWGSLNAATKKCYEFGDKECVIRAWACDGRG